jgi:CRISPR-associated endonuclease/helicase Cas3
MPAYAHSANQAGVRHLLTDHLRAVARSAREFARPLGGADLGYYLGLWHDLGKFSSAFQTYLLDCETDPRIRGHGPDHKAAGAVLAGKHVEPAALAIQGHHGGISSPAGLKSWLEVHDQANVEEALASAAAAIPNVEPPRPVSLPPHVENDRCSAEMFLRLAFSALVDADYLDTERHFRPDRSEVRDSRVSMSRLAGQLDAHVRGLSAGKTGPVAEARRSVHEACLRAAEGPGGVYRLAAPTGAGKTLSAMAFALRHADVHGLERVIAAVPFISITEQTADVYRKVFATSDGSSGRTVLEHHSGVAEPEHAEDFHQSRVWRRLAAENWDAPIIVTTTVQLFESLFSNMPSRCRKLHRLAKSVIIIDEAQALPAHLLRPILDGLRYLCDHCGTTVLMSTATQPAFQAIHEFADVPAIDIFPEPAGLFHALRRVTYDWQIDESIGWTRAAELLAANKQALAVLNTKKDALALLNALGDAEALHLSTLLCGAHRRDTIAEVKRRLPAGRNCRLVSTQVIEAGVDLDFPFAMRAIGPLDAIIQTAGRCNREGRMDAGKVIVFRPAEGGSPPGPYRTGIGITGALLGRDNADPDDPALATEYFRQFFASIDTDRERIQETRRALDYLDVARRFRMIDDDTEPVAITSYGAQPERRRVRETLDRLKDGAPEARVLLRRLQPYLVSLRRREAERFRSLGIIAEVIPGLGEWLGDYDSVRGLVARDLDPDSLVV